MGTVRQAALASLVVLMAWTQASSQKVDDAAELLKKVRETYASLRSFQFEGMTVTESQGAGMQSKLEFPFEGDFAEPYKMRVELKSPLMPVLIVSDGQTTWFYMSSTKTYRKMDLETGDWPSAFEGSSAGAGVPYDMLQLTIADQVKGAKVVREEALQLEGENTPCFVVEAEYARSKEEAEALPVVKTYWIDKRRHVVLRESVRYHQKAGGSFPAALDILSTSTLSKVRLNEPVPDELFQFTPPEGATTNSE